MNITYTEKDGIRYPDLVTENDVVCTGGMWSERRRYYLLNHKKVTYYNLLTSSSLSDHLEKTQRDAEEMYQGIVKKMMRSEGINEEMKAEDPLSWVRKMNRISASAREIVCSALIYV